MSKKKTRISAKDFLSLLENQEALAEQPAFKPSKAQSLSSLTPLQKELLSFVLDRSPRLVNKWALRLAEKIRKA